MANDQVTEISILVIFLLLFYYLFTQRLVDKIRGGGSKKKSLWRYVGKVTVNPRLSMKGNGWPQT